MFILKRDKAKPPASAPGLEGDRELAEQILKGDRDALSHLLDRHLSAVYAYLRRRTGPGQEQLVEKIIAATFEEALHNMPRFASGAEATPVRAWLLRRAARQLVRHRSAAPKKGEEGDSLHDLRMAMQKLSPRMQNVMSLALFEAMSAEEIAAATGFSQARAMRLLRGALRKVDKSLAKASGEESIFG